MYFWTCGLQKTRFDKCVKSPFSEDPSTSNIVNGKKDFSKLNYSTFKLFIAAFERSSSWKSLSEWYAES